MRERKKTIKFPVWSDYTVHVIITQDFITSAKFHCDEDIKTSYKALTVHIGDDNDSETKESFIFLTPDCDISSLVHECWHVIFHMMTYFEAKFEDEVVAYHLGYLTQQVYDFVKKRR